jgi:hypothetical protein
MASLVVSLIAASLYIILLLYYYPAMMMYGGRFDPVTLSVNMNFY